MLQWYSELYEMKKNEDKSMEVEHQKLVSRMIKSADGGTGLLHKKYQANGVERRSADSEGGRGRCQTVSHM